MKQPTTSVETIYWSLISYVTVTDGIYANNTLKDDRYRNEASTNKQEDDKDITPSEKDTSSKSNPYGGSF